MTQIHGGCTLNSKNHFDVTVFHIQKHFKDLPGKATCISIKSPLNQFAGKDKAL